MLHIKERSVTTDTSESRLQERAGLYSDA